MSLPFDDRGLLLGDGLFETLLAIDGAPVRLDDHLDRMAAGCASLGLPPLDRSLAQAAVEQALQGVDAPRAAVRLTLTAGSGGRGLDRPDAPRPRLFATAVASLRPEAPASLVTVAVRRNEGSPASRLKTLAYLDNVLARGAARGEGADEALMLNNRGEVACGAAANLFWIVEETLFTPALDCGVLAGLMRGQVLAAAERLGVMAVEARAMPDALASAQGMFLTNSLIGVRPVGRWDGRQVAASPLTPRLAAAVGYFSSTGTVDRGFR